MNQTNYITVDVSQPTSAIVHEKQYDSGRIISATLIDGGQAYTIPTGTTAMFRMKKPDGNGVMYDTGITWSGSTVTVPLVDQCLTANGTALGEVSLYNVQSQRITSFSFRIVIEKNALTDAQIQSTDYYNILTRQIAQALGFQNHPPYINATNHHWMLWDIDTNAYVDQGWDSTGQKGNVMYATFGVDATTGMLSMTYDDEYDGPDFELNNGYLEVSI